MTNDPTAQASAAARKAAFTRHHGATHPATLQADTELRNAKLTAQLQAAFNRPPETSDQ